MNLNPLNQNTAEERRKKRERLEEYALGVIRKYLRDEMSDSAPADWSQKTLDELVETKAMESQRIVESLSTPELENEFAMERHGESVAQELRMDVNRRISESRPRSVPMIAPSGDC
jgi:hypothetical protein